MKLILQPPKKSLSKAFLKYRPLKTEIFNFKSNLSKLLGKIDEIEREENQKNHIRDFLLNTYYKDNYEINTKDVKDLVIHTGKTNKSPVGVIIEAKRPGNKVEMISKDKVNCKSFQELVLYYMNERVDEKNIDIKFCIVTNIYEWFIFDAYYFEKYFYSNKSFVKQYEEWKRGQKVTGDTNLFYNEIAGPFIDRIEDEIPVVYFDFREYETDPEKQNEEKERNLISLFKLFSPHNLLRIPFAEDSNKLDNRFYKELLHIIGLEEVKEGSKHVIRRKEKDNRNNGSLIENAISKLSILDSSDRVSDSASYGDSKEDKNYNIALELCLTWINRILFLKLLEAQLINYHRLDNADNYKFLNPGMLKDFDELFSLFHHVLAVPEKERDADVKNKFRFVPYLNSTLFEISTLEKETISVSNLNDSLTLELMKNSILDDGKKKNIKLTSLEYLLKFLDAYDFSSEGMEEVQEENRTLINASVLGKVFEKINGYKDGSIFTPGFITMYMCREAIRLAVTQKFKDKYNWKIENFEDLKNFIADKRSRDDIIEFNEVTDSIRLCDPAVGSGHFLVSSLNEIIAIKSELGIFADEHGTRITDFDITIEQDELIITDKNGDIFRYEVRAGNSGYGVKIKPESQKLQRTLFHEKQKIIENCLFGVDINPNSVKICMLRLWIELLKNAYYRPPPDPLLCKEGETSSELETLPNIDINIKTGNSLISRFPLDANLSKFGQKERNIIEQYRNSVKEYKNERNRYKKKELEDLIRTLKNDIRSDISKKDPKLVKLNNLRSELDNLENQSGLFEQSKKEQKEQAAKKKKLEAELAKLNKEVDDVRSNAIYRNAFEWRFEFPEVLNEEGEFEGFDVVIGNPPYIYRLHEYKGAKGYFITKFESTEGNFDLYKFFIEKSILVTKPNGYTSLIIPNTFLTAKSYNLLRNFIFKNSSILEIFDLGENIFEDITVENVLLFLKKQTQQIYNTNIKIQRDRNKRFQELDDQYKMDLTKIYEIENTFNIYLNKETNSFIQKIREDTINLSEIAYCTVGINTGYIKSELTSKEKHDNTYHKMLSGRDIGINSVSWKGDWIKYDKAFNDSFGDRGRTLPPEYIFTNDKILVQRTRRGLKRKLICYYDKEKFYNLNRISNIVSTREDYSLKYIHALLNSSLLDYYFNSVFNEYEVKPVHLSQLPIKKLSTDQQQPFISLVDEILESKKLGKDTTALEDKIDRMVYKLYGLSEEEIKIVEGKS